MSEYKKCEGYSAAREEILTRIKLRDTALFQYVIIFTMVIGYVGKNISSSDINDFAYIIGLLSIFTIIISLIYFHHNIMIGKISYFINETYELFENFDIYANEQGSCCSMVKFTKNISKYVIIILPYVSFITWLISKDHIIIENPIRCLIPIFTIIISAYILYISDYYHRENKQKQN